MWKSKGIGRPLTPPDKSELPFDWCSTENDIIDHLKSGYAAGGTRKLRRKARRSNTSKD
jgi:hypothetical protein